jgi:hypothetical protein
MKFKVYLFLLLILFGIPHKILGYVNVSKLPCDYLVDPGGIVEIRPKINGNRFASLQPGEVICLRAGNYQRVKIEQVFGTEQDPIIIRNEGGLVNIENTVIDNPAINSSYSAYFRISGGGEVGLKYGIRTKALGHTVQLRDKSDHFELDHIEIIKSSAAAISIFPHWLPTWPYEGELPNRENYICEGIHIHDNLIEGRANNQDECVTRNIYSGLTTEGMYIGKEKPEKPLLRDINIHDNIVKDTCWEGIQIESVHPENGQCRIHDNYVENDSVEILYYGQEGGIRIKAESMCDVYNNTIVNSNAHGIFISGSGSVASGYTDTTKIYNNLIINSVQSMDTPSSAAISVGCTNSYIGDVQSPICLSRKGITIAHNTIVRPGNRAYGILLHSDSENINVSNNLIIEPGGSIIYDDRSGLNIFSPSESEMRQFTLANVVFLNTSDPSVSDYYALDENSPAVDYAVSGVINVDKVGNSRPYGNGYDLGAYEYGQTYLNGDVDHQNGINQSDLLLIISNWLVNPFNLSNFWEPDNNEKINGVDFAYVLKDWER